MGGLGLLGGPKVENVVHSGWAWAAEAPLLPLAVAWPAGLREAGEPRSEIREVGDIAPALYQRLGIAPPEAAGEPEPSPAAPPPSTVREWRFAQGDTRIPESIAPRVGSLANSVVIHAELPEDASGVLYAVGGVGGGVTCYLDTGILRYEYNIFEIQRVKVQAREKLAAGKHVIEVTTVFGSSKPRAAAKVTLSVDGRQLATGMVALTAPVGFAPHESFDVGADLGSPVSLDYLDRTPFALQGSIQRLEVRYPPRSP
jgi:arylsulfatase